MNIQNMSVTIKVTHLFSLLGSFAALLIGGTAWTANLQNEILRKLDRSVTHDQFIKWQEQLRKDNATLNVPNMGTFRSELLMPKMSIQTAHY